MTAARTTEILSKLTADDPPPRELCRRLVEACAAAVPATGVGIILMTDSGQAGTVAASDGPAALMEELQFTVGEGPCVDSSTTGRPVLQPDLATTGPARWPGYSAGALEAGVRAVFALPLRLGAIRLGVLALYRDRPGPLAPDDLQEALHHADAATAMVLHLQSLAPTDALGETLVVVDDRAEVHQATGVVSVQAEVTLPEALVLLRARAYAEDRTVSDLSRAVLARTVYFQAESSDTGGADRGQW